MGSMTRQPRCPRRGYFFSITQRVACFVRRCCCRFRRVRHRRTARARPNGAAHSRSPRRSGHGQTASRPGPRTRCAAPRAAVCSGPRARLAVPRRCCRGCRPQSDTARRCAPAPPSRSARCRSWRDHRSRGEHGPSERNLRVALCRPRSTPRCGPGPIAPASFAGGELN